MPRSVTGRKNCDALQGSKLEHHVFRRTGVIITSSACDLREQFLRSNSVCHHRLKCKGGCVFSSDPFETHEFW